MSAGAARSMAARVDLGADSVAPGQPLAYTVVNTGTVPIMLGAHYELERLVDGSWKHVPGPRAFRAWGRRLELGAQYELTLTVPSDAAPGRYRLRKRLAADRDPAPGYEWVARENFPPIEVVAEFNVVPI